MEPVEELYRKYRLDVYRYLYSLTHDALLSEDLLSDTFLRVFLKLSSFRGQSSMKTWLFGIARNVWLQHLRRQGKHDAFMERFLSSLTGEASKNSTEDIYLKQELEKRIKELLSTKEEKTRSILWMRASGYDFSEIAAKWSISENSARVTEFRTKKWLREQLSKEGFL